jgi:hypothetical protein
MMHGFMNVKFIVVLFTKVIAGMTLGIVVLELNLQAYG